jgi:hypothetical protein
MRKKQVHECDMPTYMPRQATLNQIAVQPSSIATPIDVSACFSQNSIVKATQGARKGDIGFITEVECAGTSTRVTWVWVLFQDESSAIRLSVDSVERVGNREVLAGLLRGMPKTQSQHHGSPPRFVCPRIRFQYSAVMHPAANRLQKASTKKLPTPRVPNLKHTTLLARVLVLVSMAKHSPGAPSLQVLQTPSSAWGWGFRQGGVLRRLARWIP